MIESKESYTSFYKEIEDHDLILHLVPSEPNRHSAACRPVALFVYDVHTSKDYILSFTHPDINFQVSPEDAISNFRTRNNRLWTVDKKGFIQTLPLPRMYDINLLRFIKNNSTFDAIPDTPAHSFIKRTHSTRMGLGMVIPLMKHKEIFDSVIRNSLEVVQTAEVDNVYQQLNSVVIETLADLEFNGIHVNSNCFKKHFDAKIYPHQHLSNCGLVYSQYNIYTATGRPSNRFDGVNYAALNKDNGCRACFTSRHNCGDSTKKRGKMVLIDYSAFHPRIICNLIGFPLALDVDIYRYLGELYFKKQNLNALDIDEAKTLTFRQLYGGVEKQYEHIKYFGKLKGYVDEHWKFFNRHDFVETPVFKRKITSHHIQDPNPCKLFNYILQAAEMELVIPTLSKLNTFLKNKLTKPVLYTYDSILFDFARIDGEKTLKQVVDIMKMNNAFPVKIYMGDSYDSLHQISIS